MLGLHGGSLDREIERERVKSIPIETVVDNYSQPQ